MTLLILGLLLWWGAHLFKRVLPGPRAAMGMAGKGLMALLLLLSIVLMVKGYRGAEVIQLWNPPRFLIGINNLLMVLAVYLFVASIIEGWIARKIRHKQLTAVKVWAIAHLLVNGDVASIVLFGGLLAWAVVTVIVLNRAQREWERPAPASATKEAVLAGVTVVLVVGIMLIHNWLGVQPWG